MPRNFLDNQLSRSFNRQEIGKKLERNCNRQDFGKKLYQQEIVSTRNCIRQEIVSDKKLYPTRNCIRQEIVSTRNCINKKLYQQEIVFDKKLYPTRNCIRQEIVFDKKLYPTRNCIRQEIVSDKKLQLARNFSSRIKFSLSIYTTKVRTTKSHVGNQNDATGILVGQRYNWTGVAMSANNFSSWRKQNRVYKRLRGAVKITTKIIKTILC